MRIAFEISSILEEIKIVPNGTNYVLCPHCTVISVRFPCIVGKPGSSVHVCQSRFPSLENFESGKRKYCIVLEKVREKPRIFRHPKLCSNHAPVVDAISVSQGYPLKRASYGKR